MVLLIIPKTLLALLHAATHCCELFKSLDIIIPKSFSIKTLSNTLPVLSIRYRHRHGRYRYDIDMADITEFTEATYEYEGRTNYRRTAQDTTGQHRTPQDTTGQPQDSTGHRTLCGCRPCFVANQLWFMTRIREEDCTGTVKKKNRSVSTLQ